MFEAIAFCEEIIARELNVTLAETARIGDHRWWISDVSAFERDYPDWSLTYGVQEILEEIYAAHVDTWMPGASTLTP